jgi:hypothetical protein
MTTAALIHTLTEAMQEAIRRSEGKKVRDLSAWVAIHYRSIVDQYSETLLLEALDARIRILRKKQAESGETLADIRQLCLDLGTDKLDLDDEVSVPLDRENPAAYGECDWITLGEATAEQIEAHILLMQMQIKYEAKKLRDYKTLREAMLRIGKGRTDIPIDELRKIAKQAGTV